MGIYTLECHVWNTYRKFLKTLVQICKTCHFISNYQFCHIYQDAGIGVANLVMFPNLRPSSCLRHSYNPTRSHPHCYRTNSLKWECTVEGIHESSRWDWRLKWTISANSIRGWVDGAFSFKWVSTVLWCILGRLTLVAALERHPRLGTWYRGAMLPCYR